MSAPAVAKPKAGGGKRIAVLPPTNGTPKDAVITAKIAKALKKEEIQPVAGAPVKRAMVKGVPSSDADWVELARRLRVEGIVEPVISGARGKHRIEVVVHNGLDGAVAGRESFQARGLPSKLANAAAAGVLRKLLSTIRGTEAPKRDTRPTDTLPTDTGATFAQAPAASEQGAGGGAERLPRESVDAMPAPADENRDVAPRAKPMAGKGPDADDETGEEIERGSSEQGAAKRSADESGKPRILEVEIGDRFLQRSFAFTPSSSGPTYSQRFLLVPQGRVAWFPFTYAGVFFAGEFNPRLETSVNSTYPTYVASWELGAQARYPFSLGAIGLGASYFVQVFGLGDPSDPNSPRRKLLVWPDTSYRGVRLAGNARFHLWSALEIGAEAGYRLVSSTGTGRLDVTSSFYFPNTSINYAMDASLFLGVRVSSWLEIRGGVDYRRYVYGPLIPGPDSANGTRANSAVDQYLGYTLSAVGVYGGR